MAICPMLIALGLTAFAAPDRPSEEKPKVVPALKLIVKGQEAARATLSMKPDVLTMEMHRKSFLMMFPQTVKLSAEKPARITKEPAYQAKPLYGALTVGDGPKSVIDMVFDESAADAKFYLDANQNGDLTDDPAVSWATRKTIKGKTSLETLLTLPVAWSEASGKVSTGEYGVMLHKAQEGDAVFLVRAGARVGTIKVDGKSYAVALADNTCDGVFDNARAAKKKRPAAWLLVDLNGDKDYHPTETGREVLDTDKPFPIGGSWFTAEFPKDGSELILKRAAPPPPVEEKPRTPLLGVGQTFPEFSFVYADGAKAKFSDTKGKVRVIDLWATWCGPCIAAMPRVEALYQKVKDQGVEVIGLNVMDEEAKFKKWIQEKSKDFHYRFARDQGGEYHKAGGVAEKLGVYAIPTIFLIDKNDKVALVLQGFGEDGEVKLKAALKELGVSAD